MIDPGTEILVKTATDLISNIFQSSVSGIRSWITDTKKRNDVLGFAARKYSEKMIDRYNVIKIFGMSEPVPLDNLYVKIKLHDRISNQEIYSLNELQNSVNFNQRKLSHNNDSIAPEEITNNFKNIVILGKPGAGKTTFLKNLILLHLKKSPQIKSYKIPIFISLKEYSELLNDQNLELYEFIVKQFEICELPDSELFILKLLEKGKCIILLDGLDEVSNNIQDILIKQLLDFSHKYDNNNFVLSCRVAAYSYWFENFIEVEIADFEASQIENLVTNWFHKEPKIAKECFKKITLDKSLSDLARVPLLLTLLCISYDEVYEFPSNKSDLYKEAIDAFLKKWDASRRIRRNPSFRNLSTRRKEYLLCRIAIETFEKGLYYFKLDTLIRITENFLTNIPSISDDNIEFDCEDLIKDIEVQSGLIAQRSKNNIYSFSHLTFHEYFVARYIFNSRNPDTINKLIRKYLFDSQWNEIIITIAGMLENADNFIKLIFDQIYDLSKTKNGGTNKKLIRLINDCQLIYRQKESNTLNRLLCIYSYFFNFYKMLIDYPIKVNPLESRVINKIKNLGISLNSPTKNLIFLYENRLSKKDELNMNLVGFAISKTIALLETIQIDHNRITKCIRSHNYIDLDYIKFIKISKRASNYVAIEEFKSLNFDDINLNRLSEFNKILINNFDLIDTVIKILKGNKIIIDSINSDIYMSKDYKDKIIGNLLTITK